MDFWSRLKDVFGSRKPVEGDGLPDELQEKIGYHFNNPDLLRKAMTHRSYIRIQDDPRHLSNERLEFLGDSVLGLVVADYLYHKYPNKLEGGLTKDKSLLVNEGTLHRTAELIDLGRHLYMSLEEEKAGGRHRPSITADAFEGLVGAMYLDGGIEAVKPFIKRVLLSQFDELIADKSFRNYKGDLLEYLQARGEMMPRYEVIKEAGPDHDKTFTVGVYGDGKMLGKGVGSCKKDAEQQAAERALRQLKEEAKDLSQ